MRDWSSDVCSSDLTCAYMGLFLQEPGQFTSIVEALKDIPEVVECYYTTGKYDLFIKIYARDNEHLLKVIHDRLPTARTSSYGDVDFT